MKIKRVLKIVKMEDSFNLKFRNCSLGMKQRVGIAMALLGDPVLLILDEPINGLDVDGMRIMREILTELASSGKTILISSFFLLYQFLICQLLLMCLYSIIKSRC